MGFSLRDAIEKAKQEKVADRVKEISAAVKAEAKEPAAPAPAAFPITPIEQTTTPTKTMESPAPAPATAKKGSLLGRMKAAPVVEKAAESPVPAPAPKLSVVETPKPPSAPAPAAIILNGEPVVISDPMLQEIKANISFINDNIEERDLVGQAVRKTMEQMRKNPHFRSFLTATDKETIVRGYMRAFNVAARKKSEGQEKRSKKAASVDEIDRMMNDMDLGDIQF